MSGGATPSSPAGAILTGSQKVINSAPFLSERKEPPNLLVCQSWWKNCLVQGDQYKKYKHLYSKTTKITTLRSKEKDKTNQSEGNCDNAVVPCKSVENDTVGVRNLSKSNKSDNACGRNKVISNGNCGVASSSTAHAIQGSKADAHIRLIKSDNIEAVSYGDVARYSGPVECGNLPVACGSLPVACGNLPVACGNLGRRDERRVRLAQPDLLRHPHSRICNG